METFHRSPAQSVDKLKGQVPFEQRTLEAKTKMSERKWLRVYGRRSIGQSSDQDWDRFSQYAAYGDSGQRVESAGGGPDASWDTTAVFLTAIKAEVAQIRTQQEDIPHSKAQGVLQE